MIDINISTFVSKYIKNLLPSGGRQKTENKVSINWILRLKNKSKQNKTKTKKTCSLYYIPALDSMVPAGSTWPLATCIYVTFPFRSVTLLELPVCVVIAAAPHACSRYPWLKWKIRDCSQSKTLFRLRLDLPTSWAHSLSQARSASGRLFMFSAARRERELELPEPEMRSEGLWESLGFVNSTSLRERRESGSKTAREVPC